MSEYSIVGNLVLTPFMIICLFIFFPFYVYVVVNIAQNSERVKLCKNCKSQCVEFIYATAKQDQFTVHYEQC